ncbi:MAG: PEGA domain-containing protein [Deltaproteobacteria bacterium]|nr:PEGA domain-containing protein [Deltaproteobacteria bacterium]
MPRTAAFLVAVVAFAQPQSARSASRTRVTVFIIPAKGASPKTVARASNALLTGLRRNPRLDVKDSDKLLAEFAGEEPTAQIRQAEELKERGLELLRGGKPGPALAKLQEAAQGFEKVLASTKKQSLAETQVAIGVALAEAGRASQAQAAFLRLLAWRPTHRFDADAFGPQHLPLFERAVALSKRLRRGSVELVTTPPGAKAYVDGRYVGVTPALAFGLTVGEHYATFKMPSYGKAAVKVTVHPQRQESYSVELRQSEKYLLLKQTLDRATAGLGQPRASAAMVDLRSVLFVDQVVFATISPAATEQIGVQAYLYDLRSQLRLNATGLVLPEPRLKELERLAQLLYVNVPYDGAIATPPDPPPPPPQRRRRFYATWWFWTAVGAGAAAAIVTLAAWPSDKSCQGNAGDGNRCVRIPN